MALGMLQQWPWINSGHLCVKLIAEGGSCFNKAPAAQFLMFAALLGKPFQCQRLGHLCAGLG
jgi:hypothetical protein